MREEFGEVVEDINKYKRQGGEAPAGDFNPRIGEASIPNENIGQCGEVTES